MSELSGLRTMAKRARNTVYRMGLEEIHARPLWEADAPGAVGREPADIPTYAVYAPKSDAPIRNIVVVFPGGGYSAHAEHEAAPVARRVRSMGAVGVVVRYRLAPRYRYPAMLDDALEAVRVCRRNAAAWNADGAHVGVLGFSAGGHLAALTATCTTDGTDARPDFAVLIYPVIKMAGSLAHPGCRAALLGDATETPIAAELDADARVAPDSPPSFVVHGWNDTVIDVGNSLAYAAACRRAGVACELHVYADGPHGFGLGGRGRPVSAWPDLCAAWLAGLG